MQEATVEVVTGSEPSASVIWLHGLGADGHDFEPIVPALELPGSLSARFVFPHAPVRPVTINGGMRMRAWFDIRSLDREGATDEQGLAESVATLNALVARERDRGIPDERIVLAGFSQGGAVAMHAALERQSPLAGLMALSTYLPLPDAVVARAVTGPLPVFIAHGSFDPVLPLALGRHARDVLENLGLAVEWHEYPIPHAVSPQEIVDIGRWLARVLA